MTRKVIFVGSVAFSGSTFMAMTLANDPRGYALGEPNSWLRPTQPHHHRLVCSCGDPHCTIWQDAKTVGETGLYDLIFGRYPEVEFIVDSSKNPLWIRSQSQGLKKRGIQVRNILVWKTPLESAQSWKKRGRLEDWERAWVNYHRLYLTLIDDWRAVEYRTFVQGTDCLRDVCDYLEIPFFEEKPRYWEKVHHVIGGSVTAKIHLLERGGAEYQASLSNRPREMEDAAGDAHRTVYYREVQDMDLHRFVERRVSASPRISDVVEALSANDVCAPQPHLQVPVSLRMPRGSVWLRKVKQTVMSRGSRLRYARSSHGRKPGVRSGA